MADLREEISSNETNLFIAEEASPGVIPLTGRFLQQEPNTYDDFGSKLKKVARMPITDDRQNKKGSVVGLTASGGFNTDFTIFNIRELLQGFFFASLRTKSELAVTSFAADGVNVAAGGANFPAGTLVAVRGAALNRNNQMFVSTGGTAIKISGGAFTVGDNGVEIRVSRVGVEAAAGDLKVDVSGVYPAITSTALNFLNLGLIPGEPVYIGGDGLGTRFDGANNNGWTRVIAVEANKLSFDKTDAVMTTDAGTGKTIRLFFGSVLKNEKRAFIKRRTYSLRRTLGAPDLEAPDVVQSEVLSGAVPNQVKFNNKAEDKVDVDLSFMAREHTTFENDDAIFTGATEVPVDEADLVNTGNDTVRSRLAVYGNSTAPRPLLSVLEDLTITIDNNLKENKALGHFGSFSITPGNFAVSLSSTAYFADVAAIQAAKDNADITFDLAYVKDNRGFFLDLPMLSIAVDPADIKMNESIRLKLDADAATGVKYSRSMDHTLLVAFFDYLPDAARKQVA